MVDRETSKAEQDADRSDTGAERRWGTAESWVIGLGLGLVVVALMGAAYSIGYNNGQDSAEPASAATAHESPKAAAPTPAAPASTAAGKALFTETCGSCHTLADAGTSGDVGPNLDLLEPEPERVEMAIANGGTGTGAMPPDLYGGKQAEQVAAYVAAVASSE